MRLKQWIPLAVIITSHACGGDTDPMPVVPGLTLDANTLMVVTTDYETGSLDLFSTDDPTTAAINQALLPSDAALRIFGEQAIVLDRSSDSSGLTLLDANLDVVAQLRLPGCAPHDVVQLQDDRFLFSCYDDTKMRVLTLDPVVVTNGPDLAAFAVDDPDGRPEMDQLLLVGNRVFVSLQHLDMLTTWAPIRNGSVVALDAVSLTIVDTDNTTAGVQALDLPLANPYTGLTLLPDGRVAVGCQGDFVTDTTFGIAAVSPLDGSTEIVVSGTTLAGPPSFVEQANDGSWVAVVAVPDAWTPTEMRLVHGDGAGMTTLYTSPGFTLSGLAIDPQGRAYVGNRSSDATEGVWRVSLGGGSPEGPIATGLPPFELKIAP